MTIFLLFLTAIFIFSYGYFDWPEILLEGRCNGGGDENSIYNNSRKEPLSHIYREYHHPADDEHRTAEQFNWRRQNLISIFVVFLTAVVAGFAFLTFWETRRQAEASDKTLALAYPPKFRFVDFELYNRDNKELTSLEAGQDIIVHGEVFESGQRSATVTRADCKIYWGDDFLPMRRPYMNDKVSECRPIPQATVFYPGNFRYFELSSKVPSERDKRVLYVMGYFQFNDGIINERYTLFARRYDPAKRRFVKVDNSDYEREDETALDDKAP